MDNILGAIYKRYNQFDEWYNAIPVFATMSSDEFKKGQKISPLH